MTARTLEPFDPAVVSPWTVGSGDRGVLLLHGFAGTPPETRRLGESLAEAGYRCLAPALAGHGTHPEDLEPTRWQDWLQSAEESLDELSAHCREVRVAGQSMGGTLALLLAARRPDIAAVAALAAPLWIRDPLLRVLPVAKFLVRWHRPAGEVDLYHPDAVDELYSYGRRSTRAIHELVRLMRTTRDSLAAVRAPVLICHGGRDSTVDPANAVGIRDRLVCSPDVEVAMFWRSGHALSVDVDREAVNARVRDWFDRH